MRFMMIIYRGPDSYASDKAAEIRDVAAFEEMGKYNDQLKKAGVLLAMDGLTPPAMGARFTYKGGEPKVTDGPFPESKEVIGGPRIAFIHSLNRRESTWRCRLKSSHTPILCVIFVFYTFCRTGFRRCAVRASSTAPLG